MPTKQKITKEMILESAYELVRERGIDSVNSRNVTNLIGCSTQPIFSQFSTMEELRKGVFKYACSKGTAQILIHENEADFMNQTTLWVIHLAREEPNLFKLIYLSNYFEDIKGMDGKMDCESNEKISQKLMELFSLPESACQDIFRRGYLILHGIATMIAVNRAEFSDEEVLEMTMQTTKDMVQGVRERQAENGQPHKSQKSLLKVAERMKK
ncbi:MAG: TetR/AcrR family transcriptional regulator [Oscillospiraceae bacterium]